MLVVFKLLYPPFFFYLLFLLCILHQPPNLLFVKPLPTSIRILSFSVHLRAFRLSLISAWSSTSHVYFSASKTSILSISPDIFNLFSVLVYICVNACLLFCGNLVFYSRTNYSSTPAHLPLLHKNQIRLLIEYYIHPWNGASSTAFFSWSGSTGDCSADQRFLVGFKSAVTCSFPDNCFIIRFLSLPFWFMFVRTRSDGSSSNDFLLFFLCSGSQPSHHPQILNFFILQSRRLWNILHLPVFQHRMIFPFLEAKSINWI